MSYRFQVVLAVPMAIGIAAVPAWSQDARKPGCELSVKFAWNHLTDRVEHHVITVPVTLRGTLSF